MTNINCSLPCIYQKEGKCNLRRVPSNRITPIENCPYFSNKLKQ